MVEWMRWRAPLSLMFATTGSPPGGIGGEAFDHDAVHSLLKPVDPLRLDKAVARLLLAEHAAEPVAVTAAATPPSGCGSCSIPDRLPSRTDGPPLPLRRTRFCPMLPTLLPDPSPLFGLFVPAPARFVPGSCQFRYVCQKPQLKNCAMAHHTFACSGLSLP